MGHKISLDVAAVALGLMAATPAMAASCGLEPFPPALSNPGAISGMPAHDAEAARHQAYQDVIDWQKALKTYRGCLTTLINDDNRKIAGDQGSGDKNDLDDIPDLKSDITKVNSQYDRSVDNEKTVVSGYTAIVKVYCGRKDVDQAVCQQPAR
jgi:hypothetical protein